MSKRWYYTCLGEKNGPVSDRELKALADRGELLPDDDVWHEGMPEWKPAKRIKGLFTSPPTAGLPHYIVCNSLQHLK